MKLLCSPLKHTGVNLLLTLLIIMNFLGDVSATYRHISLFHDTKEASINYFSLAPDNPFDPSNELYRLYIIYILLNNLFVDYPIAARSAADQNKNTNIMAICTIAKNRAHLLDFDFDVNVTDAYLDRDLFDHLSTVFGGSVAINGTLPPINEYEVSSLYDWFMKQRVFIMHVADNDKQSNSPLSKVSTADMTSSIAMSISNIWSGDYESLSALDGSLGGYLMVEEERINYVIYRYSKNKRELGSFSAFNAEAIEINRLLIEALHTKIPNNTIGSCLSFFHNGPSAVYIKFLEAESDLTFDDIPCEGMMGWGA
ncbi:hypothetical protein KAFR_0I02960 [Kazachstania africana CBS 2517]|uniref:Uncharacterized protein n=1 Tax=Kazachstania africana (strain ATCC 22294 / BCRC 22015 / CBS 2517 / CECT 1963 / NBRC 1671 / NRRL Y-8276) TaxID=1071382 RepID=H2B0C6_KAZAF|nr:hypothetical protein KAFR_0I02960 [Kazachstania africana CBS 2517]CCF60076.1 hypothetical protein KAFR_0I02960 [Kazachstania africana CBS 2517]